MKKVVNTITTIALLIVWVAVIVGFVRGNNVLNDSFLLYLIFLALAMTLEKGVNFFEKKWNK